LERTNFPYTQRGEGFSEGATKRLNVVDNWVKGNAGRINKSAPEEARHQTNRNLNFNCWSSDDKNRQEHKEAITDPHLALPAVTTSPTNNSGRRERGPQKQNEISVTAYPGERTSRGQSRKKSPSSERKVADKEAIGNAILTEGLSREKNSNRGRTRENSPNDQSARKKTVMVWGGRDPPDQQFRCTELLEDNQGGGLKQGDKVPIGVKWSKS